MKPKWIIILVLLALVIVLLVQNAQVVTYQIFLWKISISQVILVPMILIIGFVIGYLMGRIGGKKSGKKTFPEQSS